MTRQESAQIELTRVICILCMMWVHVSPGMSTPSVVSGGSFSWVGDLLAHTLGRISTTTLSFIAGYLFWQSGAQRPFWTAIGQRLVTVVVPMLVWSALFLLFAMVKEQIIGHSSAAVRRIGPTTFDALNAWAGLTAPMANDSLVFLRDLFVATVVLRLIAPWFGRFKWPLLALGLALVFLPSTAPILFRPQILLFMLLGAAAAQSGLSISRLSSPRIALGIGLVLAIAGVALSRSDFIHAGHWPAILDLFRRLGIGLLILALTAAALRIAHLPVLVAAGRHAFLAFLSHALLIGQFWVLWLALIGDETQPAYLVFYLLAPFTVFLIAVLGGRLLDRAPRLLQILLRGRQMTGDRFSDRPTRER